MLLAPDDLPRLPVRAALADVDAALRDAGAAVLVAPPGTGKTTLVPLALAADGTRVVVAEPRRVAARAAARRMADLLGEAVGGRIGYTVRGDRRVGRDTLVEVVTTGVLVRRLQRDPELAGTSAVILDECHERHLDSDLTLAFLVEVRATLRPDLRVLATSATADTPRLAQVLGEDGKAAPVLRAEAETYPIDVRWTPPAGAVAPPHGLRVDPRLLDHVAVTIRRALADGPGDVLAFLPGAREIETVAGRLRDADADVVRLHGRQSASAQDAALRAGPRRRVVLATAVAESSLTVPGVRAVVDAGLSRVPRRDHARGLGALVTVPVSRAAARQRAGRAGREAPGRVYRCWSAAQHARLPAQPEPEIAVADLTGFALDLALWGHPDGAGLRLPDAPPEGPLRAAREILRDLGALRADGAVTARGRALAGAGLHPRLARALSDAAGVVGARRAAEIVALLDDPGGGGDDLVAALRAARRENPPAWRAEVRRLTGHAADAATHQPDGAAPDLSDDRVTGLVVALAYPERVARVRDGGGRTYLMAGGTAAELSGGSALTGSAWLAIADADRAPGARTARIRWAAPLDEGTAREAAGALLTSETQVGWIDGDVVARTVQRLGALDLAQQRLDDPDPAAVTAALQDGLRRAGLGLLAWSREASELRERLAFAHAALGDPWPPVDDAALLAAADQWLGRARRRADLARIDMAAALRGLLPWQAAARLDEVAPERMRVPSGSRIRVSYADPQAPVLAVKLQEVFGWTDAPRVADGTVPVLLHLLSPAGRPVAVTRDLASFWSGGYAQVRAEMRGRYPRHPWPEDPTAAAPTRRANPRAR
ncbi:ATP-dependent helicase HrpB [Mangrovihabitans endophyticus]|nr:ATP-dependent helicase HrpB [Mangrovihabitans endophyticus]